MQFCSLTDLLEMPEHDYRKRPRIALTVDDGYEDFSSRGWPLLKALRCHATVFVTTGPVVDRSWFWWDRLVWAVEHSSAQSLDLPLLSRRFDVSSAAAKVASTDAIRQALKRIPDGERCELLGDVERALGVEIPEIAPPRYSAMSPDDVRRLEAEGVAFGAHTVTHPILSRCDRTKASLEIAESVKVLSSIVNGRVTSFAYPNGGPADFGEREVGLLRQSGVDLAVTLGTQYLDSDPANVDRLRVPRFVYTASYSALDRITFGFAPATDE